MVHRPYPGQLGLDSVLGRRKEVPKSRIGTLYQVLETHVPTFGYVG